MISLYQGRLGECARSGIGRARSGGRGRAGERRSSARGSAHATRHVDDGSPLARSGGVLSSRARRSSGPSAIACGEARCHINIGIIQQRDGEVAGGGSGVRPRARGGEQRARRRSRRHSRRSTSACCYLRRGQLDLASERFEEALELLHGVVERSPPPRRRCTTWRTSLVRAKTGRRRRRCTSRSCRSPARIGQPDVELGARAGQALASLAVGSRSVAEDAMRWIRTNVEPRPEWWFQGRDLVDALRIRLAAERGDDAHAMRSAARSGRRSPASTIRTSRRISSRNARRRCAVNADALLALIDQIMPEVEALGFAGVAQRLAVLRLTLGTRRSRHKARKQR